MVISIESAIQHSPTQRDSFTWNQPNPSAFTACVTVYVSSGTTLTEASSNSGAAPASIVPPAIGAAVPATPVKLPTELPFDAAAPAAGVVPAPNQRVTHLAPPGSTRSTTQSGGRRCPR
uniref:Uncharacterized protein n=1 Tax=Anopheles atroparvus TaxID=41427 RepID=A0A182IS90_ANOAO